MPGRSVQPSDIERMANQNPALGRAELVVALGYSTQQLIRENTVKFQVGPIAREGATSRIAATLPRPHRNRSSTEGDSPWL